MQENNPELSQNVGQRIVEIEKRLERTTEMFDRLLQVQTAPLRLDYYQGPRYMCLCRKRDRSNTTIGVYWRKFLWTKAGQDRKIIWKSNWHPKRVPPAVIRKLDEENHAIFTDMNQIAKAIYSARELLVHKKQSILATLNNVERSVDPRLKRAEQLFDEFVI